MSLINPMRWILNKLDVVSRFADHDIFMCYLGIGVGHHVQYHSSTLLYDEDPNLNTSTSAVATQDELPTPVGNFSNKGNFNFDNDGMENLQEAPSDEEVEESDCSHKGGLEDSEVDELMDENWSDEDENDGYVHPTLKF